MRWSQFFIVIIGVIIANQKTEATGLNVVYAVNAGGDKFEDSNGIVYQKDPSRDGIDSDFGRRLTIDRVSLEDEPLYQTERYSHSNFGYDIPIKEDGKYVLVMKFSEVYFRSPGKKVFDIVMNNAHLVVQNLDIYAYVGFASAHDEIVPFEVSDNKRKLTIGSHSSDIVRGKIRLDFVKGQADNPKINAFYVIKGTVNDIPSPPISRNNEPYFDDEEMEDDEENMMYSDEDDIQFRRSDLGNEGGRMRLPQTGAGRKDVRSGEPAEDPWDQEPPFVVYMPLIGSIAASVVAFFFVKIVNKNWF